MSKQVKAIQTEYKGYKFRSRLEARWAVFFDTLGIGWEYETEGYELDDGQWYLPDFFLHDHCTSEHLGIAGCGYWVEIKGGNPTTDEIEKMRLLSIGTKHSGVILNGIEPLKMSAVTTHRNGRIAEFYSDWLNGYADSFECYVPKVFMACLNDGANTDFRSAFIAAKQARFEHGEVP